jgi:hypothetical protein
MIALLDDVVFSVPSRQVPLRDVVLSAALRGEWTSLEEEVRQGMACIKRLDKAGDRAYREEVEAEAREFRFAHNLISAEEMEAWLHERAISIEDWVAFVRRSVLRRKWSGEHAADRFQSPVADAELTGVIECEAICSGRLARFCSDLAARASICEWIEENGGLSSIVEPGEAQADDQIPSASPAPPRPLPLGMALNDWAERLEGLAQMEKDFQRFCGRRLTPTQVQDQIRLHPLEWIRLDFQCLKFPSRETASEAALCVREDGEGFDKVAARAKVPVHLESSYLGQLDPALQDRFAGVLSGDLVGPTNLDGEFALYLIVQKSVPSVDDPEIRKMAEEAALKKTIEHEVNKRVRWYRQF